ncbi:glycosyltransferase [Sutcliffiella horikoshii]|uniref:glycosyltransferase n=1 Tax=Sutcliffiella horikoshii TaxID=79883 RepID=UPI00384E7748
MKRKLAIVIPSLRGGGSERVIINLINNLDLDKFEIKLLVVKKEGPYIKYLPNNVSVVDLKSERVRYSLFKMVRVLNEYKPDVILSTLGHLNLVLISIRKFLKNSPKVIVRESNTPSMSLTKLSNGKKRLFKFLYRCFYPKADLIIAQCKDMKQDIVKTYRIDERKIDYIYNPIDLNSIISNAGELNPFDDNKTNIVAVGRLTYQKGFDVLLRSFKLVNQELPNSRLTILGEGSLKDTLDNQVKQLSISDSVSIIGFKDNPYPYYKNADLFVLSSRWEGFPNVLLEALACNTKVVATKCKSGPKEILENGKYGQLTEVENEVSLAKAIIESLNSEYIGQNRAKDFDISVIIKQYEKLLLNI